LKDRFSLVLPIALGFLVLPIALLAHHGTAIYDNTKTLILQGTVTDWSWTNPHCLLEFDVIDDKGTTVHWVAEVSNPSDMVLRGWSKRMFKPGDKVTVTTVPAKNGQPIGRISQVVVNGKSFSGFGPVPSSAGNTGKQ